jgi:hypothetical protein
LGSKRHKSQLNSFVPFLASPFAGYNLSALSDDVVELEFIYDSIDPEDQICGIGMNYNANDNCTISFEAPRDMKPPILIYYELTNFYQNHRSYSKSRDDFQLAGQVGNQDSLQAVACDPLNKLDDIILNPCGMIANTFFNDKFNLVPGAVDDKGVNLTMLEEGIAWTSDLEYRFAMPDGFNMTECPPEQCDASCCELYGFSCTTPDISKKDGLCYAYDYPEDDSTQYLYETYPNLISPLEHVTNEHFVVWMRVATRPTFRKLYGYMDQMIPAGTKFSVDINLNYVVESFGGTKALLISTNNIAGGKNPYLGKTFYYMGFFCLGAGILFAIKHWFRPRRIADRKYLHFKED